MRFNWKKYLPVIGILLFLYILFKVDLRNILFEVRNANVYFLGIAIVLVFVMMLSETTKWFTIARFQNIPIPFKEACINPNNNETIHSDTNKCYIYGVIARLAILAASKELYNIET